MCFFTTGWGAGAGVGLDRNALGAAGAGSGLSNCARMTGDSIATGGAVRSLARMIRAINTTWMMATAATVDTARMRAAGGSADAVEAGTFNGAPIINTAVRRLHGARDPMAGTSCAKNQEGDTERHGETDKQFHLEVLRRTRAAAGG
jgi:hypothetical protein